MTDKPVTKVIFTGRLTKARLKELADTHLSPSVDKPVDNFIHTNSPDDYLWNPAKNHNVISLVLQPDGHYIGVMWKGQEVITVRDLVPEQVLTQLLTHA